MNKNNLNALRDRAYKTACEHGFHDTELSNEHLLCLVISELMEAVEADRKGKTADMFKFKGWQENRISLKKSGRTKRFKEDFDAFTKTAWKTSLLMPLSVCLTWQGYET